MEVKNAHIASMLNQIVLFRHEIDNSQSADSHNMQFHDIERIQDQYLPQLRSYVENVIEIAQPVDAPHWHKRLIPCADYPALPQSENPFLFDITIELEIMYVELAKCQSNDMPKGLNDFDLRRLYESLERLENYMSAYIGGAVPPVDMPEAAASES